MMVSFLVDGLSSRGGGLEDVSTVALLDVHLLYLDQVVVLVC